MSSALLHVSQGQEKIKVVRAILDMGFESFFTDVDAVWWGSNRDHMSCSACQIGPSVSYRLFLLGS
jgi:Nucleotide-diphospho-sugar transferase